jgi:hypothetical protein
MMHVEVLCFFRLFRELRMLTNLDEVILDDNEVTEQALSLLPVMPNLRSLMLNKNKVINRRHTDSMKIQQVLHGYVLI